MEEEEDLEEPRLSSNNLKDSPLVSVIIPCYNSQKYLAETLESVLSQSYINIELLCIDNGSTDTTLSILNTFKAKDSRIQVLFEAEKGASYARSLGMKNANGTYIQFLDSDDIISIDKLDLQIAHLQENDLDLVVSDRVIKDENLSSTIEQLDFSSVKDFPLETAITQIIITGNPIYKKAIVDQVGGYTPNLKMAQDWEFHIKLFLENIKIGYLPGAFLISRTVVDSLSSNWKEISFFGSKVITQYRDQLARKNVVKNQDVFNKIVRVYSDTAIFVSNHEIKKECLRQLDFWNHEKRISSGFGGFNKILSRTFGFRSLIAFKRVFSHKISIA
jgi:glycosyltransferase involved in cell wall biosynthesis